MDYLTPKQIAKRIKSKGLQKLKWYCQMCEKQCRDANGFKNHCLSQSHLRNMELFRSNAKKYVYEFSKEFETSFLDIVKHRYVSQKVSANVVYNELIRDKNHVHLSATRWKSLSGFIRAMGEKGVLEVEDSEKGLMIRYIKKDEDAIKKMESIKKKEKHDLDDEQRMMAAIRKQMEALKAFEETKKQAEEEIGEEIPEGDISFTLKNTEDIISNNQQSSSSYYEETKQETIKKKDKKENKRKLSTLDLILQEEERRQDKIKRRDYWLHKNIIVKVLHKGLENGKYYKKKGIVIDIIDKYIGEIKMIENGDILRIDQDYLETVIPNIGGSVLVVNGAYRGEECTVESIDKYSAQLKITTTNQIIKNIMFDDFCKLAK